MADRYSLGEILHQVVVPPGTWSDVPGQNTKKD